MNPRPEGGDLVVADAVAIDSGQIKVYLLYQQKMWDPSSTVPIFWLGQAADATQEGQRWVLLLPDGSIGFTGKRDGWKVISKFKEAIDGLAEKSGSRSSRRE